MLIVLTRIIGFVRIIIRNLIRRGYRWRRILNNIRRDQRNQRDCKEISVLWKGVRKMKGN